MQPDLPAAARFMTTHARLVDRQRFDLVTGRRGPAGALAALAGYRNADGGYGWGLEPDLRSPESQPVGALHALEIMAETGAPAGALADWLASVTLPDGGLPFALPAEDPAGSAPLWVLADSTESSLHLSTAIVALAQQVARHDPSLRAHQWLAMATDYCWREVRALREPGGTYLLRHVLWFLDAVHEELPGAPAELHRFAAWLPESAVLPVEGGIEGEAMYPLDFAPRPEGPVRELIGQPVIARDLARLAGLQRSDGGWTVDFAAHTDAAALEWRGYATVNAVKHLLASSTSTLQPAPSATENLSVTRQC
jgi:hypothetical protein